MKWSPQQDAALQHVDKWLNNASAPQVFRLFGYAGTGKTTLAKHFAADLPGTVLFGAFTGKAAHVMRQKGCPGATTIHQMIYHSKEKSRLRLKELELEMSKYMGQLPTEDERQSFTAEEAEIARKAFDLRQRIKDERVSLSRPIFELNEDSDVRTAKLVIIDECSMVDGRMGEDLLSFGTKILVLGDPAQLPPVFGSGFFIKDIHPDVMLEEIHRQAAENPIIDLATRIRRGEQLVQGSYGESSVRGRVEPEEVMAADQVLVGRNKTRHASNRRMRELKGIDVEYPVPNDKLCCWRNNHDKGLMNGSIWFVDDVGDYDEDRIIMTVRPEDEGYPQVVEAHTRMLMGDEQDMPWWERKEAEEFQWGYALTCHKSQGSQWDNVLVFDESWCFRENRNKWLYTAVTRAAEKVTVVK